MLADAQDLGDKGSTVSNNFVPDWVPAFKQEIDGLILVSGESHLTVEEKLLEIERIFQIGTFNASIHKMISIVGDVRPGKEKGHEQSV